MKPIRPAKPSPSAPPSRGIILLAPSRPGVQVKPIPSNPRDLRKWAPADRALFEQWLGHLQAGRLGRQPED